jgi:N-acetylglucosaminyldiphosphoundecaprenol N-acetyl-beta-D-mannosaminyltransferase
VIESFDILGVKIAVTNLQATCESIAHWIKEKRRTYVCITPVSMIVDCQSNPEYREIVNSAGMATPDGMPLVWLGKRQGRKNIERTYGPDLMRDFCNLSQDKGYRHYFYGGSSEITQSLVANLKNKFPKLDIAGAYAPPMRSVGEREDSSILANINQAKPDVLWVGLGSPKQDYWMHNHRNQLNVPVMIGVGAAFDYFAGTKPQAPRWMRQAGLEWFFRLCCEPRRLWCRYLIGNTRFVVLLLKNSIKRRWARL